MKIRSGYVSNSSSSSFICLGVDITHNENLKTKFVDEDEYELNKDGDRLLPDHTGYHVYNSQQVLGWELGSGSSDDGSFDCEEVYMEELAKYSDALEKITGIKPKLMGGIYAS